MYWESKQGLYKPKEKEIKNKKVEKEIQEEKVVQRPSNIAKDVLSVTNKASKDKKLEIEKEKRI